MAYKRIFLKLSGEALMGDKQFGIDHTRLDQYALEIKEIVDAGIEVAIVIGGGNIFRGIQAVDGGIDRARGDYMGMLATVINSMALQSALEKHDVYTRLQTAIKMEQIAEPYIRRKAVRHLEKGRVVIFGAGTGNPYFTTDTAACLRGIEIDADVILKATKVDGVFSDDPVKNPEATLYRHLSYNEIIDKELKVMDLAAFTLARDHNMPLSVFNMNKSGALKRVIMGEEEGTLISSQASDEVIK